MRLVQVGGVNTSIPSPCRPAPRRWTSCEVVTNRVAGSLSAASERPMTTSAIVDTAPAWRSGRPFSDADAEP
jgi:hypothetical protein